VVELARSHHFHQEHLAIWRDVHDIIPFPPQRQREVFIHGCIIDMVHAKVSDALGPQQPHEKHYLAVVTVFQAPVGFDIDKGQSSRG
jgi:hypothetical protein